jgi:very-short-patch-repair endonuclease
MNPIRAYDGFDSSREVRLAALAAEQHGVVATRQLLAIGYSAEQIERRAKLARLHRLRRGIYAVGHTHLTARGYWIAAVLACGPDAVLSHRAAAALWGLRSTPSGLIDVTAPSAHHLTGIRCHVTQHLHPDDHTIIDAIPVTTIPRAMLDLAETLHSQRLRTLLEAAQRQDLLDPRAFDAVIARHPGRHGLKLLRQALTALTDEAPWTQSEFERRFLELIRETGLPEPQVNVIVEGELADFYWPEHNLIVELDGWEFHKTKAKFTADRRRDTKLQIAGYRVIRLTYDRVRYESRATARDLITLLNGR